MTLGEFKEYIESQEKYTFKFGISKPFSWRGSYDEVAFSIVKEEMSKEEILLNIDEAFNNEFSGYKGGEFRYDSNTDINFEYDIESYSDNGYCRRMISEIEDSKPYQSEEGKLVKLAFC